MSGKKIPAIGAGLPIVGPHAGPEAIETVALAAERLGFSSLSVTERLLLPLGDGWTNVYGLPDWPVYDALETLSWLAAKTSRIGLRSDVIVPLFQQPVVLARRLATIDRLSNGRLIAGVGVGWMPEEFEAADVGHGHRGARFGEAIQVMRACWGSDPVRHEGKYYRVPAAKIGPKPVKGSIPIHIGGVSRPALERAARIGDGVTLAFRSWDATLQEIAWYREAGGAGPIALRGGPMLADAEHPVPPTTWTEPQVIEDLERAGEAGVDEFVWDLNIVGMEPTRQEAAFEALAAQVRLAGSPGR